MLDECKLLNIPIHTRTKAVELLRDESLNCTGVKAVGPNGPVTYKAKGGVVICTGGFHNNKDLVTRYMGGNVAWMPLRGSAIITGENYTLTQPFFPAVRQHGPVPCRPDPPNYTRLTPPTWLTSASASHLKANAISTKAKPTFMLVRTRPN